RQRSQWSCRIYSKTRPTKKEDTTATNKTQTSLAANRHHSRHVKRIRICIRGALPPKNNRRGMFKQTDKRRAECSVWRSAVCFLRWATIRNIEPDRVARRLGISASTLKNWMKRWRTDQFEITERGRPAERSKVELRNQLMSIFALMGPHIGLPTLREMMPDIPKNELIELMQRYRYAFKRKNAKLIYALRWQRPGAVWAIDHSRSESFAHSTAMCENTAKAD
ncbi:hypothetical protein MNBD_ALPHA03-431, partial [hydrothermal vent metagenome]